ncbi:MAG: hypothetical protein ACHQHN_12475 [Sphingobacteriales bacterium]
MGIFDFFKRNKNGNNKASNEELSPEQTAFADAVLSIIKPSVEKFGFKQTTTKVKTYSTRIVFRKHKQYIEVSNSSYPTDYPYLYWVILGEGNSDDFSESDWNSVSLFALAQIINPTTSVSSYNFPIGDPKFSETIGKSITQASKHLLKYGAGFLNGDLTVFYQARKKVNEGREPYKISIVDENGSRHMTYEPESVKQKKKYS